MHWISVKDRLPVIPPGLQAVTVLVATYDRIYADGDFARGYSVHTCTYGIIRYDKMPYFKGSIVPDGTPDFMSLFRNGVTGAPSSWGPTGDPVTHWMPLPEAAVFGGEGWIQLEERLPEIPAGKFGMSVLVTTHDHCADDLRTATDVTGMGYAIVDRAKMPAFPPEEDGKPAFMEHATVGGKWQFIPPFERITHWRHFPEAPAEPPHADFL